MKPLSHLKLFVDPTEVALYALYKAAVENHNYEVLNNPYPNAGFDLYVPSLYITIKDNTYWIDHRVKATMTEHVPFPRKMGHDGHTGHDGHDDLATLDGFEWKKMGRGYCIYPRSSISKTPLLLANHVGVIDSGYSGNLIGAFRHISASSDTYVIEKGARLLQICHPGLMPFTVEMVEKEQHLFAGGETSQRGNGGFGSTGK
jgi:hypothetical protein